MSLVKILSMSFLLILSAAGVGIGQQIPNQPSDPTANSNQLQLRNSMKRGLRARRRLFRQAERRSLRQLNLSDEQRAQRKAIMQRHLTALRTQREQLFALRQRRMEGSLTAEDRDNAKRLRQELRTAMQTMRGELRNTLTEEQRMQIETRREQMKLRREERLKRRLELQRTKPSL